MRVFVQGKTPIDLETGHFVGQGGEGAVYVKDGMAYKVYSDPAKTVSAAKIGELSALGLPNILKPNEILSDARGMPIGYTMAHAANSLPLCQIFSKAFRERRRLDTRQVLRMVRAMQDGIRHVHAQHILLVDLNETNFLVDNGFRTVYFIDVDSYQTPSFPATAIMETVFDRHATHFDENTDWFSFAIVSFQMFIGIHPYKGIHSKLKTLDERMRENVSVFHKDVSLPAACLPFEVIPTSYRDWYQALFDLGERRAPPDSASSAPRMVMRTRRLVGSRHFEIEQLQEFPSEVWNYLDGLALTADGVFCRDRLVMPSPAEGDLCLGAIPHTGHAVAAWTEGGFARFRNLKIGEDVGCAMRADEIGAADGRIYVKQQDQILQAAFLETSQGTIATGKPVSWVLPNASRLFEGVAMMNLLGSWYAVLLPAPGRTYQVRLVELDGYRLIDARFQGGTLMATAAKEGRTTRFIFRFDDGYAAHDARVIEDVPSGDINFVALATGVCLHMSDREELELFSCRMGSEEMKVISDPALRADCRLIRNGSQALFACGRTLYKFAMRRL